MIKTGKIEQQLHLKTTLKKDRRIPLMTPGKTVYSECFPEYALSEEEIRQLQNCLLEMFLDIRQLCDDNGIRYMMSGGSCLGTVRHEGFIPWDDDIDLMMTRAEYKRFRAAFFKAQKSGLLTDYLLAEPLKSESYYFKIPKIYKKNTEYLQINYMGNPHYNMVSLDIFLIEYMPESRLIRAVRSAIFDFAFYASSFCLDDLYPSPVILEKCKTDPELRRFYRFRRSLGALFTHFGGIRFYLKVCSRLQSYPKKTSLMGVPSSRSYSREILDARVFTELASGTFCGYTVNIPRNYDAYLRNLFGNYMEIPPEDEREIHTALGIRV